MPYIPSVDKDYLYSMVRAQLRCLKDNDSDSSSEVSESSEEDDKKGEKNIQKVNSIRTPRSLVLTKRSRANGQNDGAAQD